MRRITILLFIAITVLRGGAGAMAQGITNQRPRDGRPTPYLPRRNGHAYGSQDDIQRIDTLHQAGLKHDHSQLPALLDAVHNPPDHFHFFTAVHALARLGDLQALPALEQALHRFAEEKHRQGYTDDEASGFVEVARARLLAEAEAHKQTTARQRTHATLDTFMATLHLDASTLNTAVTQNLHHLQRSSGEHYARETYALRELADMIYQKRDAALTEAAKSIGIDFSLDAGAKYKVQLALLSSPQRVEWLINELSNKQVLKGDDFYLLQLAADEGKPASRAAAAKLLYMDKHREQYPDTISKEPGHTEQMGFAALFRAISGVGDKEQEPVIAHFLNDKEKWISYYANQVYPGVKTGIPWKWRNGY